MGVNVVFVNIDWKILRHNSDKSTRRNMAVLHATIADIVRGMKPTVLCMCEVGEVSKPLNQGHMEQIAKTIQEAWQCAVTEEVNLKFLFETGAPYMTAYDESQVQCTEHRILRKLYSARGESRTAQVFLCRGPDDVAVDIVNVHAPSGTIRLQDASA